MYRNDRDRRQYLDHDTGYSLEASFTPSTPLNPSRAMSFDLAPMGKRAFTSAISGAVIGSIAYGAGGGAALPLVGTQVPAPLAYGAATGIGSLAADAALAITSQSQFGQNSMARTAIGVIASGYVGGMMLESTEGTGEAGFYENAGVAALSYYAGDYGAKYYYNVPGQLC